MTISTQSAKESLQALAKKCVELVAKVRQRLMLLLNPQKPPESK
jgi:hypothetical protein